MCLSETAGDTSLVRNIDTPAIFVAAGVGGLVLPSVALYAWFKRGGLVDS